MNRGNHESQSPVVESNAELESSYSLQKFTLYETQMVFLLLSWFSFSRFPNDIVCIIMLHLLQEGNKSFSDF